MHCTTIKRNLCIIMYYSYVFNIKYSWTARRITTSSRRNVDASRNCGIIINDVVRHFCNVIHTYIRTGFTIVSYTLLGDTIVSRAGCDAIMVVMVVVVVVGGERQNIFFDRVKTKRKFSKYGNVHVSNTVRYVQS